MAEPFKVNFSITPGVKPAFFKEGKPKIVTYKYRAPGGDIKTVNCIGKEDNYLVAMNPYSTKDNPEITPEEIFKLKKDITKSTSGTSYINNQTSHGFNVLTTSRDSQKRSDYFQLLDLYSSQDSPGGRNITPEEQAEIVDTFAKWYY